MSCLRTGRCGTVGLLLPVKEAWFAVSNNPLHVLCMCKTSTSPGRPMILGMRLTKRPLLTATISAKIVADIPKHRTRQMRRGFRQKFDLVAKVRPAITREMYRRLTDDASSASCGLILTLSCDPLSVLF